MSGRVTRKRARVDSEPEHAEGPVESEVTVTAAPASGTHRDEDFWFDDGTVILVAGDVEFRVYKGVLTTYSPVFRDMFSLPQPPQASGASESCPVVALTDSPVDLRHLLRMCMPQVGSSPFLPAEPSFSTVAACVRLAHKYQMGQLLEHALDYLNTVYAPTLDAWTAVDVHPLDFKGRHAISVVNIARLTGCKTLLPTALLTCCGLPGELIVRGYEREDGSREQLTLDDIGLCFAAKSRLIEAGMALGLRILAQKTHPECTTEKRCRRSMLNYLAILDGLSKGLCHYDPTASYAPVIINLKEQICASCFKQIEERDLKERQALWKELPSLLGITVEGWGGDEATGGAPETA